MDWLCAVPLLSFLEWKINPFNAKYSMSLRFATADENDITSVKVAIWSSRTPLAVPTSKVLLSLSAELPSPEWGVIQKPRATPWVRLSREHKPHRGAIIIARLQRLTALNRTTQGAALGFCIAPRSGLAIERRPTVTRKAYFHRRREGARTQRGSRSPICVFASFALALSHHPNLAK